MVSDAPAKGLGVVCQSGLKASQPLPSNTIASRKKRGNGCSSRASDPWVAASILGMKSREPGRAFYVRSETVLILLTLDSHRLAWVSETG